MRSILNDWHRFLLKASLGLILALVMLTSLVNIIGRNGYVGGELLVYSIYNTDRSSTLMLYDSEHRLSVPILINTQFGQYIFSSDGRIAYAYAPDNDRIYEIYVLNALEADSLSINITQTTTTPEYPLAWSPDGRYLAYSSFRSDESTQIFVWDGETSINITPGDSEDTIQGYSASWSFDGRLAFVVGYVPFDDRVRHSEIYLWDGYSTANLSQNPIGSDEQPVWNIDGRIAFRSVQGNESDIFVWDGVSIQNGSPDVDTFTNVLPELTSTQSIPVWTNDGHLAFSAGDLQNTETQIYVWDGQTATNISQNPRAFNSRPQWSPDGRWTFVSFISPQRILYVRDVNNQTLLTVANSLRSGWSVDGRLVFCVNDYSSDETLLIWNGQDVVEIARGADIWAQWQNGSDVWCSLDIPRQF